tara:strand:- start:819 stop:1778 length:960 start_codon:yes stop_codon:yes gene_type:complete
MTRQNINTGSAANDGTGDTLRTAGGKINDNFIELYNFLGAEGDSSTLASRVKFQDSAIVFEGLTADANETRLFAVDPTKDNVINLPDSSGNVILTTAAQTLTNKTINLAKNTLTGTTALFNTALSDNDFTTLAGAETLTNKTLTAPLINNPKLKLGASLNDSNNNELIKFTQTASAVNEITVTNGIFNTDPKISATGDSSNVNLMLAGKGVGSVEIAKAAYSSQEISVDGAASTSHTFIIGNKGSALAVGLAAGTTVGEHKIFSNKGAGTMTVTPSPFANGTSFALVQNRSAECIWDGTNWFLLGFGMRDSSAGGITIS